MEGSSFEERYVRCLCSLIPACRQAGLIFTLFRHSAVNITQISS